MIIYYINFIVHSVKERELLAKKEDEKRQKELKRQEQAEQRRKQAEVCSLLHIFLKYSTDILYFENHSERISNHQLFNYPYFKNSISLF